MTRLRRPLQQRRARRGDVTVSARAATATDRRGADAARMKARRDRRRRPPRRRQATLRLFLGPALGLGLRAGASSSSRLRASAAARSARSRASRSARALASISALAALFLLARAGVDQRAGARLAFIVGQGAQNHPGGGARGGRVLVGSRGAAAAAAAARSAQSVAAQPPARRRRLASPTCPGARRFTFSTTTAFERPCEKL